MAGNTEAQAWFAWHLGKMISDGGNTLPAIRYEPLGTGGRREFADAFSEFAGGDRIRLER